MRASLFLKRLLRDNRGATAIEYGLILALLCLAIVGVVQATAGEAIRRATLRVVESTDGKKDSKLTIDLRDVLISSVQVTGNSTGGPLESVSMNFAKINQKYQSGDK